MDEQSPLYYDSIRHKKKGDAYILANKGTHQETAAASFFKDQPRFEGKLIVQQRVLMHPIAGAPRKVWREYEFNRGGNTDGR